MSRILTSYYAFYVCAYVLRTPVRDNTAGFVCYSRKVLEAINFDRIKHIGYGFQIEMKFVAWKLGFKIVEVPIVFTDRQEGTSKMSKGIFKEAIFGVIKLRTSALFEVLKGIKISDLIIELNFLSFLILFTTTYL